MNAPAAHAPASPMWVMTISQKVVPPYPPVLPTASNNFHCSHESGISCLGDSPSITCDLGAMVFSPAGMLAIYLPLGLARTSTPGISGSCSSDFKICAPSGARTDSLGPVSSTWGDLFDSIVDVVSDYGIAHPAAVTADLVGPTRREQAFCCSNVADCLLVAGYDIPMCWDRFTTNVFFPDGTYGTVVTGEFNTSDGTRINLVYGDYTLGNGTSGNIYGGISGARKPDTSTMPMPSPWTSTGEGSAIPATGLGTTASLSTVTTTISATTVAPSTGAPITVIATMTGCNRCPAYNTTIPGPTQPGGTRPASTSVFTTGIITPSIVGSMGGSTDMNLALCLTAVVMKFAAAMYL